MNIFLHWPKYTTKKLYALLAFNNAWMVHENLDHFSGYEQTMPSHFPTLNFFCNRFWGDKRDFNNFHARFGPWYHKLWLFNDKDIYFGVKGIICGFFEYYFATFIGSTAVGQVWHSYINVLSKLVIYFTLHWPASINK